MQCGSTIRGGGQKGSHSFPAHRQVPTWSESVLLLHQGRTSTAGEGCEAGTSQSKQLCRPSRVGTGTADHCRSVSASLSVHLAYGFVMLPLCSISRCPLYQESVASALNGSSACEANHLLMPCMFSQAPREKAVRARQRCASLLFRLSENLFRQSSAQNADEKIFRTFRKCAAGSWERPALAPFRERVLRDHSGAKGDQNHASTSYGSEPIHQHDQAG